MSSMYVSFRVARTVNPGDRPTLSLYEYHSSVRLWLAGRPAVDGWVGSWMVMMSLRMLPPVVCVSGW